MPETTIDAAIGDRGMETYEEDIGLVLPINAVPRALAWAGGEETKRSRPASKPRVAEQSSLDVLVR